MAKSTSRNRMREHSNGSHRARASQPLMLRQNPIDNLMYDWLTVLQSKAEGINAYEKYIRDAEEMGDEASVELFRKLHEQDIWQVKEIKQHLEDLMLADDECRIAGRGSPAMQFAMGGEDAADES